MYKLDNQRFGRLLVLEEDTVQPKTHREKQWFCLCDCGNTTVTRSYLLRKGITKSCGCLRVDTIKNVDTAKHGYYNTRTYHSWEGMKQRCLNPNSTRYSTYGAVGVTVCERWFDFKNFLEDMGERPEGKTLDRINPYGNYEPGNCRWATYKEQVHNRRRSHVAPEEVSPPC